MSDSPNRISYFVSTKRDKYGPGVDIHVGATTPAELDQALAALFGADVAGQVRTMVQLQVASEYERVVAGPADPIAAATKNLADGGVSTTSPSAGTNGVNNGHSGSVDSRVLGQDEDTGRTLTVKNGKHGWYVTDGETNANLFAEDDPATIGAGRGTVLIRKKKEWQAKKAGQR